LHFKSESARVQFAIALYLALFLLSDAAVWTWFLLHRHSPGHLFPMGERAERFGDLLHFSAKYQIGISHRMLENPLLWGSLFPRNYPPFAVLLYIFLLQHCAPYALVLLLTVIVGGLLTACILLWLRTRREEAYHWYIGAAIFATGLFGWGTAMTVIRGNIEGVLWIAVALGAYLFSRRCNKSAAAAFGVACCVKPQALLWLAFLARRQKYRAVIAGLITAALVSLGSLLLINPNPLTAYRHISGNSDFYKDYVVSFRPIAEAQTDHSLLQSMKMISRIVRFHGFNLSTYERLILQSNHPLAVKLYHAYLPLAAAIGLFVLWRVWNKPVLNQIFAVACVSTVLPMIAADYTLTVLLIPMGFFLIYLMEDVASGKVEMSTGELLWFLLPCAWIMAAEPLWILHGVLKCAAILVLLAAVVMVPLPTTVFGELKPSHDAAAVV
jgi:hypothetical protein